jgi:hypothetical protein
MALRLSKALGTSPEFWYGMQANYDLWQAKKGKFRGKVRPVVQRESAAAGRAAGLRRIGTSNRLCCAVHFAEPALW